MINKEGLYTELKRKFAELSMKLTSNRKNRQTILCTEVNKKFGFPIGMVSDIVTQRVDMQDALEVLLFAIASVAEVKVSYYFSEREIKEYSQYKYQANSLKFPFTFASQMVEIKPDEQYIGRTSVKELMQLRDAQIINYNANTQRTMTLKRGNDYEYYKIALNRKAVDQISELLQKKDFIPNTLTFNLAPETDFTYKNGKLTINEQVPFDILDGYHRYIAMSNLYNLDETFDYPMEIRILFLSEENAKQFIYQEDQRTPLSKADSNAMNKNDAGVKVCRFVKQKLGNEIVSQQGIINETLLVKLIDLLYIKNNTTYERSKLISIANEIVSIVEDTAMDIPELLDTKWSNNFTIAMIGLATKKELKGKELYITALETTKTLIKEEKVEQLTLKRLNKLLDV